MSEQSKEDESTRLRLRITGRVQGVGFRYFTLRAARELGVSGWVRNEPDGSVACEVAGEAAAVETFLAAVRRGPRFGRVDEVQTQPVDAAADATREFEIR